MLIDLRRMLHRRDAFRLLVLAAAAIALTLFVAPRTNRIYYDEQIYQGIGQNLSDLKLAQMCNDGTVEYGRLQCWNGEYNKQPYAYPHLLSLVYRIFGVSESIAFFVNAAVMALTVCLVYLLTLVVFGDRRAAFLAGLIMVLIPQQLLWSATAAVEPSASMACVAAVLCAAYFRQSGSTVALGATAVATAYAMQFRVESVLIVPVVELFIWRRAVGELGRPRLWMVGLLALALAAVHLGHLTAVRSEGWGTSEARLSFGYVLANLEVNGRFYLADGRFPVVFTILAASAVVGRPHLEERLYVAVYFLVFFGIFLMFYAGSYNYGADVRYSLMTYPALAVLGGLGAAGVVTWVEERLPGCRVLAAVAAALVLQFLWYAPVVRATTEEAWAARADVRFARSFAADVRGNAYVLTHNPSMFHIWGVNAGQMSSIVTNPRHLDFLRLRYAHGVYLHWNFWCNVPDPVQQGFCRQALEANPVEAVREYRERDQRYILYSFRPSDVHSNGR